MAIRTVNQRPDASTSSASQTAFAARNATTSSEIEGLYRHVDTRIDAVRSEMKGEIATVMAEISKAEAQRSLDYSQLKSSLDAVRTSLPSKGEMWKIVGSVVGGGMALLALLWAVFGAGASVTGVFADQVLEQKEQQSDISKKLDDLIKAQADDRAQASQRAGQTGSVHSGTGAGSGKP